MALLTLHPQLALVLIVFFMAAIAVHGGVSVALQILVAIDALYCSSGVCISQFKPGFVVLESAFS